MTDSEQTTQCLNVDLNSRHLVDKVKKMVDKSRLAVSKGQLGPICDSCGVLMTFGESCTIDGEYVCWDCYVKLTGADTSTDSNPNPGLRIS